MAHPPETLNESFRTKLLRRVRVQARPPHYKQQSMPDTRRKTNRWTELAAMQNVTTSDFSGIYETALGIELASQQLWNVDW
jgi:hypothetical protein